MDRKLIAIHVVLVEFVLDADQIVVVFVVLERLLARLLVEEGRVIVNTLLTDCGSLILLVLLVQSVSIREHFGYLLITLIDSTIA